MLRSSSVKSAGAAVGSASAREIAGERTGRGAAGGIRTAKSAGWGPDAGSFVKYGDRLQLAATSAYMPDGGQVLVGDYRKPNRFVRRVGAAGTLFVLPPMASHQNGEKYYPSVFTVIDPDSPRLREHLPSADFEGKVLHYGDPFILIDRAGRTWSNRTSFRTGYVGPRRQRRRGEMFMIFSRQQCTEAADLLRVPATASLTEAVKKKTLSRLGTMFGLTL